MSSPPPRCPHRSADLARTALRSWRRINWHRPQTRLAPPATADQGGYGGCCTSAARPTPGPGDGHDRDLADRNRPLSLDCFSRVHDGEVARRDDRWQDHGHRVPGYVTAALDELLTGGLVMLADPDPMAEDMARAALTNAGTVRFEQLCQTALGIPAVQFTTSVAGSAKTIPIRREAACHPLNPRPAAGGAADPRLRLPVAGQSMTSLPGSPCRASVVQAAPSAPN
jgi:hypothetical protein